MKLASLLIFLTLLGACNSQDRDPTLNDDYVLIEFASKLEEDAEKFKALGVEENH